MRIIAVLLIFCFASTVFSQDYKFGKVSKEELQEKFNPKDSTANATYLYKKRYTYFQYDQGEGFRLMTDVHERIKIYNQEGFNYATKQLRLHVSSTGSREELTSIKGYTYNIIGGKIEDFKLAKDGIFESKLNKYNNQVKFTMPNIKPGSVVEYKYTIKSPFVSTVDDFILQHNIPIKKLDAKFEAPEYFTYKMNTKGFLPIRPKNTKANGKITFVNKTRTSGSIRVASRTSFSTSEVEYSKNISIFNLENIPALKDEPYVNNINNYRSSVAYELSFTKFPQSTIEYYSTTWEDVVKRIFKSPSFGKELNKSGYFEDKIDALIDKVSNPAIRMTLIYNYLKSQVKWNGFYGYYTDEGVKAAFKNNTGNVADINLMLTAMLRYAGLKANPVLVSTRKNGIPLFPTREGYNYVVTHVRLPEGVMLLDATSQYSTINVLPLRTLNWQGRVMAEHGGSELIDLYPKTISKNIVSMLLNLDEEGNLKGKYRSTKTNHKALSFRKQYNSLSKDDFLAKLDNKYNGLEILDYKVENDYDVSKPIVESYSFIKENQADVVGDKLYFSPLFFFKTSESPFKLDKREFPIDFGFPSKTTYRISISLPQGYKVEYHPEQVVMKLPDNLGGFKYNISSKGNLIQVIISTELSEPIVSSQYYDAIKSYFNDFIAKEGEQIILTKI
ncbi:DUF3857 domain-containing protein [uncultured Algibacter sp.]|uniref:DUF3857 domain-containing protein n=1 Tax=uncultured Algibacter sp. TaxID=298659 RepID=UPI0032174409